MTARLPGCPPRAFFAGASPPLRAILARPTGQLTGRRCWRPRTLTPGRQPYRGPLLAAIPPGGGGGAEDGGNDGLDIDQLASQLSQAGAELKKSMDQGARTPMRHPHPPSTPQANKL